MWKVFLSLLTHRFLLVAVALFTINSKISPSVEGRTFRPIQPAATLWHKFIERAEEGPEARVLIGSMTRPPQDIFQITRDPFVWLVRWVNAVVPIRSVYLLLLISNLFLVLFLWELTTLGSRMALPEVAASAAILVVLWVTSYELSLGSSVSLSCFLLTMLIRHSIDNLWLFSGIGLGLLGMVDLMAVGVLPLLLYFFWHFQRHFPMTEVCKRLLFFLLPLALVVVWQWKSYVGMPGYLQSSALYNLVHAIQKGNLANWPLAQSNLGQTISLAVFFVGAIAAAVVNTSLVHKVLPLYLFLAVLCFSTYNALASRMLLAGICLEGITAMGSGIVLRLIQLALIILSCYEIVSVF